MKIEQSNDCIYLIEKNDPPRIFRLVNGVVMEGLLFESDLPHRAILSAPGPNEAIKEAVKK